MQRDVKSYISSHPSDEELDDYMSNRLDEVAKSKIVKHLIECNECSDVVALVMKYGEKKTPPISNNITYEGVLGGLGGLVASILIIFIINSKNNFTIGDMNLSQPMMQTMSPSPKYINKIVDGDKIVQEIENSLDKTILVNFIKAQNLEIKEKYDEAIAMYKKTFRDTLETFSGKDRLKWQIVIYYHIAKIKFEKKDKDSDVYKKRVQFWIQQYVLGE
jgi:hypothetical protein